MTHTLSHTLCKRLMEMGLESSSKQSWFCFKITGSYDYWWRVLDNDKGRRSIDQVTLFTIADLLTKENLVKVFGEEDWCYEHIGSGRPIKGIIAALDTTIPVWQYHRDQLAAIYSTDGIQGVQRYLEDYLSKKGE